MAGLADLPLAKHQWVSQQNFDIMMTCMDCHDTSSPFHPIIPNASTLPHQVSSITFSSSTPFLLH
jgi:hypothetical protein